MAGTVELRLYSLLRELAGTDRLAVEAGSEDTVGALLRRALGGVLEVLQRNSIQVIVLDGEGRRLDPGEPIGGRRVLHVMPPPSGGGQVLTGLIHPSDDPEKILVRVVQFLESLGGAESDVGGIALFVGIVRGNNRGSRVVRLVYEAAEELAEKKLRELAEWALGMEGIRGVAALHAVGPRVPGEITMIVGVAGVGRSNVFPVLEKLVDRIKHEVPIWKKEERDTGTVYILGDREARPEDLAG